MHPEEGTRIPLLRYDSPYIEVKRSSVPEKRMRHRKSVMPRFHHHCHLLRNRRTKKAMQPLKDCRLSAFSCSLLPPSLFHDHTHPPPVHEQGSRSRQGAISIDVLQKNIATAQREMTRLSEEALYRTFSAAAVRPFRSISGDTCPYVSGTPRPFHPHSRI